MEAREDVRTLFACYPKFLERMAQLFLFIDSKAQIWHHLL